MSGSLCQAGQELAPGQSCKVPEGKTFRVRNDGHGCLDNVCAGNRLDINGFKASKIPNSSRWRIDALPTSRILNNFELKTKRLPNGHRELIGPLKVRGFSRKLPNLQVPAGDVSKGTISVNSGFVTDFSSIPTVLHWVVRWSQVDVAGVVHDFLYRETACSRAIADDVWLELVRSGTVSVGRCRAWLCWAILRGFGRYNRPAQPEPHTGWLLFAGIVLGGASCLCSQYSSLVDSCGCWIGFTGSAPPHRSPRWLRQSSARGRPIR